jgi:hypothetical protein
VPIFIDHDALICDFVRRHNLSGQAPATRAACRTTFSIRIAYPQTPRQKDKRQRSTESGHILVAETDDVLSDSFLCAPALRIGFQTI